ncbi:S-methyl-5-thioribose-1-phosphate isomerase [Eggerthella lenta]|uniref:S-methyl-5-thioribose-1-phosphate isomerase n=1 Tax=Eggerthella lenta TaxID=84112 RepID=UPI0032BF2243
MRSWCYCITFPWGLSQASHARASSSNGAALLRQGSRVLTHCNAGSLATAFYGTALGVVYAAAEQGKIERVYADETRPVGQGARLTSWELARAGVPCTLVCDNMAASLMAKGEVDAVIVGADRIAANGDAANKIGTYGVAVLARHHGIPFYVAAPTSTIDPAIADGSGIPIEERDASEVLPVAIEGVDVWNPAFDVTPAGLITRIVTERGAFEPDKLVY